jgi:peptidoglycan L-alanyl-D-glutamate endopeptidase CwlK
LWEIGEAEAKRVVTNALVSNHESGRALDVVPLINGKPSWNVSSELWLKMGAIGKKAGFVWGGDWVPLDQNGLGWDCPHYELPKSVESGFKAA